MVTFPAYAWEAQPGDVIDGRTVVSTADDGTTATVTFTEGEPLVVPRETEVSISREWVPPQPATPEQ